MDNEIFSQQRRVAPLVRIIIKQAMLWRREGRISEDVFDAQIHRLAREELEPNCLTLLVRRLEGGRTRFLVKDASTGMVCDLIDFAFDGTLETEANDVQTYASHES